MGLYPALTVGSQHRIAHLGRRAGIAHLSKSVDLHPGGIPPHRLHHAAEGVAVGAGRHLGLIPNFAHLSCLPDVGVEGHAHVTDPLKRNIHTFFLP